MKKVYSLVAALMLLSAVNAQRIETQHSFGASIHAATDAEVRISREAGDLQTTNRGGDFFCEDFSNGLDGNNPFGEWTIEDSGGNTIWMMADANSPAGEFSTNIGQLASPSAGNGWVIFDCDAYNTPIADGVEDVTGWLTSPTIDMTDLGSVIVDYYQYFRYCCFSTSPLTLEVSVNGGDNWTVFPGHGSFFPSANTASTNPLNTKVDISCIAAGEAEVLVRFGYDSNADTGYSHYYWGLDDICIYENPALHDGEVVQVTNGDIFEIWEYRVTPLEQAITEADGGLLAGVIYRNNGSDDLINTVITVEIVAANGVDILATVESDAFTLPAQVNEVFCPAPLLDTMYIATGWVPDNTGDYFVRASLSSEETDESPENNTLDHDIEYTDYVYGHDDEENHDLELRPRDSDIEGLFDPTGYGNFFTVPNEGSTAYGIYVQFGPSSGVVEYEARVYTVGDGGLAASDYESSFWELNEDWIPNGNQSIEKYIPLDDAVDLFPGVTYFACVISEFESEFELTVRGEADSDNDNSTAIYEVSGGGDFIWFQAQTATPAVRMVIEELVSVAEIGQLNGIQLNQNMPNPFNDNSVVQFSLQTARNIVFEVHDIQGRIIETINLGTLPAGAHQVELNSGQLSPGIYTYTLVADEDIRLSKKMIVSGQ
jgi:hypothetical protein